MNSPGSAFVRLAVSVLLLALASCNRGPTPPAPPTPEKPRAESELALTTLSAEAVRSLEMRSEPLRRESAPQYFSLPGWVALKQGNEATLTAPVAGYVRIANGPRAEGLPLVGLPVKKGRELFFIEPVLSPVEQVQMATLKRSVRNELIKAGESMTVARSELLRVSELQKQGLRGLQDVEQARVRLKHAEEDEAAARFKLTLFGDERGNSQLTPVPIIADQSGTVLTLSVTPGQFVPAGAALITFADLSELWFRVPVPEADFSRIALGQPASIPARPKEASPATKTLPPLTLPYIAFVPQVDRARHTVDLLYQLPAKAEEHGLRAKDQMTTVEVPLEERRAETLVPYSAVVFDAHGGAWVYLDRTTDKAKGGVYERRRVELGPTVGKDVVVRKLEWKDGERVVVHDVGSLFSREFYKAPPPPTAKPPVEDDD